MWRPPRHLQGVITDSPNLPVFQQRIEICKLRQGDNLILGFSIGGGIDQDPGQNPFSEDKTDKVREECPQDQPLNHDNMTVNLN